MSKLELWEFLREDGNWHKAADLRERFNIRQQTTLKNWTDVPFIMSYVSNKGKVYRFNKQFSEEYDKAIQQEVYIPPIKLKNGREVEADIPEPENYTVVYPFPKDQVGKAVETTLNDIAGLGPEWNWVKEAIVGLDSVKLSPISPSPKAIARGLSLILNAIVEYNGHNFEGVKAVRDSLSVGEMNIEDIRQAELQDIMKHVPKPKDDDIDYESFFNSTT